MSTALFDLQRLFQAVDAERRRQGLAWTQLSESVGVSVSTIRRFGTADDAEADGVLALVSWLGVAPELFVSDNAVRGERLPGQEKGYVRVDMELVAKAEQRGHGARSRTRPRTRTTIQHLVAVAQECGRTVVSLTRMSEM